MLRIILIVGTGGFIGSVARYLIQGYFNKITSAPFPYGTLVVNVLGCLIIGILFGMSERFNWFTPELRFFLSTGFCGGFTTFSTFALENLNLLRNSDYVTFGLYSIGSFAIGLLAVFIGFLIFKPN